MYLVINLSFIKIGKCLSGQSNIFILFFLTVCVSMSNKKTLCILFKVASRKIVRNQNLFSALTGYSRVQLSIKISVTALQNFQ